MLDLQLH